MYVIEWDFLPAVGFEAKFVAAYGPDGIWVELFRQATGYLGTELRPLSDKRGWYRTIDRWRSEEDYRAFRRMFGEKYAELDSACELLTQCELPVGSGVE
jgi:hypothetical protein